ncbi:MAG: histidine kinase [Saprospiraceae bacterium]
MSTCKMTTRWQELCKSIHGYGLVLCLLLGSFFSDASYNLYSQQPFPTFFHRFTPEQGLSQATNSFVLQDSRGFVWVSSIDGLNRYDGHSVRVYRPDPLDSLAIGGKNMQSRFFEAPNGDLWFCTYEAINCYRRRTDDFAVFRIFDETGKIIENGYYAFYFDRAGRLWLRAGEDGLYWFDTRTEQQSARKGSLIGVRCYVDTTAFGAIRGIWSSFFSDSTGIRYTQLNDTAGVVSERAFFKGEEPTFPPLGIADIRPESDTLLWLVGRQGLVAFNPKYLSFKIYSPRSEQSQRFWAILSMDERTFALSSPVGGVWLFDKIKRIFTRQILPETDNPTSLPDREVEEMYRDGTDNLWLSHWNTGLSHAHLHKQKFRNIRINEIFPEINDRPFAIGSLVEDDAGQIWCTTEGAGILVFKNGQAMERFLPNEQVVFLLKDHAGEWWALTRSGVFRRKLSRDSFEKISNMSELVFGFETEDKRLLVSGKDGVFEIKKMLHGKPRIVPAVGFEHLKNRFVDWMYEDKNGTFYFGKDAATLSVLQRNGLQQEHPFGYMKAAHEDLDGHNIWLATTSGLVRMDKTTFGYTVLDESNGLPNQYLYSVIPDSQGNLWMGSNRGILRYTPATGMIRQYRRSDGIWADEFYTNAWLRTASGEIWMGNRDVINLFRPEAIRDVQAVPKIQINNLKVNDLDWKSDAYIGECSSLEFPFSENTLAFNFVALEYSDPANNRLKYKMEGYDEKWVDVPLGAPGFARYAKLPPGHYTFKIMAANSDGIWNPAPRELSIQILAPFWQTWWFMLLIASALTGTGFGIYKYRLSQIQKEYAFKQKTVESEMKALRAQMNPHFIFNSLNSINAYILRNERKIASGYLTEFALLMRQILDNSARETISLENEIEFLQSYLRAEAMRLENKLTWDIRVSNEVDTFETEIPSMILQPYIENAVWHGIAHKPKGGKIFVSIGREASGALLLTVEDKGIGRARARELRTANGRMHESKGLKITEERLALYDQKHGTHSAVETTDLFDSEGNGVGTRVEIRIS